jgi:integrase/recombinase XerD
MRKNLLNPSFPSLVQRFFTEYLVQQRGFSLQTVAAYRDAMRLLLLYIEDLTGKAPTEVSLTNITADVVLKFLDHLERERNNSVRSRNARLAAIRSFLTYASHHDLDALGTIQRVLALPLKRFERPMLGFLSREEMQAIIAASDSPTWTGQRDRALLTTLYNTGARVSEVIKLRIADVYLNNSAFVMINGKGRKQRQVPLWRATTTTIALWKQRLGNGNVDETAPLFPNRCGVAMTRANVLHRLTQYVQIACHKMPSLKNRRITPHTIRHTTAMHLLQSGIDISVIALWLGHESPSTTHMYIESDLSMKERALNALEPPSIKMSRYQPKDSLIQFLETL